MRLAFIIAHFNGKRQESVQISINREKSNTELTGHSKVVYSSEEGEGKSSYELLCNNFKVKSISEVFLLYRHL